MTQHNVLTRSKKKRAGECFQQGKFAEAEALYRQIAKLDKRDFEAQQLLGTICYQTNRIADAAEHFRAAVTLQPRQAYAVYQLGCTLLALRERISAIETLRRALAIDPNLFDAWVILGNAYAWGGQLQDATDSYQHAIRLNPGHAVPYCNLGNVLADQGRVLEAIESWRKALQIQPDYVGARSNLLVTLNYDPANTTTDIFQEHLEWARLHARPLTAPPSFSNSRDPDRVLRIGYVTPDIREHSVAYFLEPLFSKLDRSRVTVYCYSDVAVPDDTTRRLQALIDQYRMTAGLPDEQLEALIRADNIDILVDLSGHTSAGRLTLFTRRPAPVLATYLGYPNTTGLPTIDYRLTDAWADPPGASDALYTEKLVRLPSGFLCYAPPPDAPDVSPAPVETNGYITFGSFNHPAKITPEVIGVWSRILTQVANARLILKYRSFTDDSTRNRYLELFTSHGINPERIEFFGLTPAKKDHLASYQKIDIALDTFPYNGTTTTCDTLWMGVPVVTRAGNVHAGRVGVSLLTQLGLQEFIADSDEDYVRIAAALARSPERVRGLRSQLRSVLKTSSLCDADTHAREMEAVLRTMWQTWCQSQAQTP